MGVMNCSRKDCPEIMCHTYISGVGYICSDCQKEFKDYLEQHNLSPNTEKKITTELKLFMQTTKGLYESDNGKEISVSDFFNKNQC